MNVLLAMRAELICLVIMIFFCVCCELENNKCHKQFQKISFAGLLNIIFDIITLYTVNNREGIEEINHIAHIIFYFTAILFCYEFLAYIVRITYAPNKANKYIKQSSVIIYAYLLFAPFIRPEYIKGRGICYSGGVHVIICFGIGVLLIVASFVIVVMNYRRFSKIIAFTLISMTTSMIVFIISQIFVPELLLTGGGITMVTVAVFFTVETPMDNLKHRAMIDLSTGVKSKKCYEEDMKSINKKYFSENSKNVILGCMVCEIVKLSEINADFGLLMGDNAIQTTADVMSKCLKNAFNIYRITGDTFIVIYVDVEKKDVLAEISNLRKEINDINKKKSYNYYVAIGFNSEDSVVLNNISDLVKDADKAMEHQKEMMSKKLDKLKMYVD